MPSIGGNWEHLASRYIERMEGYEDRFKACLNSLVKRVKARKVPNREWYMPVRDGKNVVGYICGQGTYVSTVLGMDMSPHGEKI